MQVAGAFRGCPQLFNRLGGDKISMEVMDASPDCIEQESSHRRKRQRVVITNGIGLHHTLHTDGLLRPILRKPLQRGALTVM